jgi:hypothetical protein
MGDGAFAYVGITRCGCAVAATIDSAAFAKDVRKTVVDWMRDGLHIERHSVEWVRANLAPCKHKRQTATKVTAVASEEEGE